MMSLRDCVTPQQDSREEQAGQHKDGAERHQALADGVASR
jgi:hypothetical protein